MNHQFLKKNQGVTFVELMVVVSVIILLSAIILPSYWKVASQFALEGSAYELAQDIRKAAEMGMSAKKLPGEGVPQGGYGIYFEKYDESEAIDHNIFLYADKNGDETYSSDEEIETIYLEKGVKIARVEIQENFAAARVLVGTASINFKPPAPIVKINNSAYKIFIFLTLENDLTKEKTIKVNKAGLIEVE